MSDLHFVLISDKSRTKNESDSCEQKMIPAVSKPMPAEEKQPLIIVGGLHLF